MRVALGQVEHALLELWREEEERGGKAAHASLLTLVALVSEPELLPRANDVIARVIRAQPARTITVVWHRDGDPEIVADVALHRNPDRDDEAVCDAVALETFGAARRWIPDNVERLLLPGVPSCAWWVGDLPDFDDLYDRMVRRCDVALVNSSEMDLRDIEKLSRLVIASKGTYALADLTWVRLRGLQDLIARFFDDPMARPYLDELWNVTITYSPRDGETDVASTRVGLLIGWMAHALGIDPATSKWSRDARGTELSVRRTRGGMPITFRIEQQRVDGVHAGAVTSIRLSCGPDARFELTRQDDPRTVVWSCHARGVVAPSQTLRLGQHEEHRLLSRVLERPRRDALLEASLEIGTKLLRPVAPRPSALPRGER